jgi:hypothetical protein
VPVEVEPRTLALELGHYGVWNFQRNEVEGIESGYDLATFDREVSKNIQEKICIRVCYENTDGPILEVALRLEPLR